MYDEEHGRINVPRVCLAGRGVLLWIQKKARDMVESMVPSWALISSPSLSWNSQRPDII